MWLLSPFFFFFFCGVCFLTSFVKPLLKNAPVFQACPSPWRQARTQHTLHTRLVCCVLFSCLILAPLMLSCFRYLSICFFHLLFVFSLSLGTPWQGSQRLACHLHDPRSGFFYAICFVRSIFSSSSIFYLFVSLSRGTPSLGSQRVAPHLHDPRTRHSGLFSAICFFLSIWSYSSIFYLILSLSRGTPW